MDGSDIDMLRAENERHEARIEELVAYMNTAEEVVTRLRRELRDAVVAADVHIKATKQAERERDEALAPDGGKGVMAWKGCYERLRTRAERLEAALRQALDAIINGDHVEAEKVLRAALESDDG